MTIFHDFMEAASISFAQQMRRKHWAGPREFVYWYKIRSMGTSMKNGR